MPIYLKQSTASQEIPLGYFVDSTDGNTEETGLTINNTDILVWKSGATTLAAKHSGGATHISNGIYYAVLDATDTDTLGSLVIFVHVTGALTVRVECVVLAANVYDSMIGGGDVLDVSATQFAGQTITCAGGVTVPAATLASTTNITSASGVALAADQAVNVTKVNGTAQTARDLGASVLISPGTGVGQLDVTSGVIKANLAQILGTALTETAGQIAAAFKQFFDVASPSGTMKAITAVATVTNLTNAPTNGDFTATMKTSLNAATPASVQNISAQTGDAFARIGAAGAGLTALGDARIANLDATISSRSTLTAAGVWDALLTGIATVGSIGKLIKDNLDAAITSRLAPTVAARTLDVSATGEAGMDWANIGAPTTVINLSGTTVKTATDVETDTADIQGRLPAALVSGRIDANVGAVANNAITAASIATDAIDSDALAATAVTKIQTGLSTLTVANIWDALLTGITTVGSIGKLIKDYLDAAITSRLASGSYVAPDNATITLINNKTTNLPASPAATGDIPSAATLADAVWDEAQAGHVGAGSFGKYLDAQVSAVSAPTAAVVADAVWNEAVADHLGAGSTGLALNSASAPSAAAVADAVWDEAIAGHVAAGSTGLALSSASAPSAAIVADAVWDEVIAGHVGAGSTGEKLNATAPGSPIVLNSEITEIHTE